MPIINSNSPAIPRSQLGALVKELRDVQGNRDGIWENEDKAAGSLGNRNAVRDFFDGNPLAQRTGSALSVGLSRTDEMTELRSFRSKAEKNWKMPVADDAVLAQMNNAEFFALQKSLALVKMGRAPNEVTEKFVMAKGSVDGEEIPARNLFTQRFLRRDDSPKQNSVVVVAPGFLETGRTFYEQIDKLNRQGHDVVVMDQQWAGHSDGKPGGIDRGFGISRDVAAVTADAAQWAKSRYGNDAKVTIFGNSMGGGPGALGAATMNDGGRLQLDGPQMPHGVDIVLQAPFLGATPSLLNGTLNAAARLPLLNRIQMPALGLPDLTDDPTAERKVAQGMVLDDIRGQLSAFRTALPDIATLKNNIAAGMIPQGRISIVHSDRDTLADYEQTRWLVAQLQSQGKHVDLTTNNSTDHVLSQDANAQNLALDAINRLFKA